MSGRRNCVSSYESCGRRSEARKGGFETRPYEAKGPALGASVVGLVLEVGETLFEAALAGGAG